MLARILSRLINVALITRNSPLPRKLPANEPDPRQIGPWAQPAASVTEHTTRKFEPAFNEARQTGIKTGGL
jgi:hypothetical protein